MNYAYLSSGGILHISSKYEIAKQYSRNNKLVSTDLEILRGLPAIIYKEIQYPLMVYSMGEAYLIINNNIYSRKRVKLEDYPEVYNVYMNLIGDDKV